MTQRPVWFWAGLAGGCIGLLALLTWGVSGLPPFGHYPGPYGDAVIEQTKPHRHATNAVTTIVMDIRAVDTAGEELVLLAAVVGVLMLLRRQADEREDEQPGQSNAEDRVVPSAPVRVSTAVLVAPAVLLGEYVVFHGQLTPGGGFQGGVILAVPTALLLLAAQRSSFDRWHSPLGWEIAQAIAVTVFLAIGFAGLLSGSRSFLANILPLGSAGTVFSAGTIPVLNIVAGPAVATAIVLVVVELLHQVTGVRPK